jgi:hypothetical protein
MASTRLLARESLLTLRSTIYGICSAWQGTKTHSQTDWRAAYNAKRRTKGPLADCLEYDDVEHLIIIPKYVKVSSAQRLRTISLGCIN